MRNPLTQHNLFFRSFMALLMWIASTYAAASFPLPEYEAKYAVSWYGIQVGESIHILKHQFDNHYHFEVRTEPKMKLVPYHHIESSDFSWEDNQILPHNYYYRIHEGKRRKKGNVVFDWTTLTLNNSTLKPVWKNEISRGLQDKITQTLSLRLALKSDTPQLTYTVAEDDKIKNYTFTLLGEEVLKTRLGRVQAAKVEHVSRKGARTTLWLAKQYDYLPVKMTQIRQGKVVVAGEILSYSPTSK